MKPEESCFQKMSRRGWRRLGLDMKAFPSSTANTSAFLGSRLTGARSFEAALRVGRALGLAAAASLAIVFPLLAAAGLAIALEAFGKFDEIWPRPCGEAPEARAWWNA